MLKDRQPPRDGFTTDGGLARFRGFDSNLGTFQDLIPTGNIVFGNTYSLSIALAANTFSYSVGGATASFTSADPTASISSVILQGYNTSTQRKSYDIVRDDLNATGAVPEPATWAIMLMGFGTMGASIRCRRKQSVRVTYA